MDIVVKEDVASIIERSPEITKELSDQSFFITGATGMIGRYAVCLLAESKLKHNGNGSVTISVRNGAKAEDIFSDYVGMDGFFIQVSDVSDVSDVEQDVDIILHAASPTQPEDFLEHPVDIIEANAFATRNLLDVARNKNARFCLLSTLEVYGAVEADSYPVLVTEKDTGVLDQLDLRSAYPESKKLAENLCVAYAAQYGVQSTIVRIAPVISPIVDKADKRVFAQFINNVIEGNDITVFSDAAEKQRSYTYIADAVLGVFTAILNSDEDDFVFNLANNNNVASIQELAETIIKAEGGNSKLSIVQRDSDSNTSATTGLVLLDSQKLLDAGWIPHYSLVDSVNRALAYLKNK